MESKIAGQLIRSPADYAELLEEYHRSDYADGIVVVPLTERRVSAAVAATGRSGDKSIGSFDGREQVSIRALAEVAVLAGCRPPSLPLLVAALAPILADHFPPPLPPSRKPGPPPAERRAAPAPPPTRSSPRPPHPHPPPHPPPP